MGFGMWAVCGVLAAAAAAPTEIPPSKAVEDAAIQAIVSNMTLEEKARQLATYSAASFVANGRLNRTAVTEYLGTIGAGRLHDFYALHPSITNELQRMVVESSRFGIAAVMGEECTHGYQKDGHTQFPAPLTSGATWNVTLLGEIGRAVGAEARSFGATECWAPILGLAREPRWGRTNEEFSEDTFLAKTLGVAVVRGIQNSNNFSNDDRPAVVSLLKHYTGYSGPTNGINDGGARLGRREFEMDWLPVFQAAIKEGALGVMTSYNAVDGEAVTGSKWLLTDVLRTEFGFEGATIGDFGAIGRLWGDLKVATGPADGVAKYINAGGNTEGYDVDTYEKLIIGLVKNASTTGPVISEATLDARVADVLRVKMRVGLVNAPETTYVDETLASRFNNAAYHQELALDAARQSQVLLQNGLTKARRVLPLDPSTIHSVAVVGGNADNPRFGDYTGAEHHRGGNINNHNSIGVLEAIKRAIPGASVSHVVGVGIAGNQNNDQGLVPLESHGCGAGNGSEVIRQHHFKTPTGEQGVLGEYWDNSIGDFSRPPNITRTDPAISWHWYIWGPDGGSRTLTWGGPPRLKSAFSARWRGSVTSDADAIGSFTISGYFQGQAFGGARLYTNGKLLIDVWDHPNRTATAPFTFCKGEPIDIVLEYRKGPGNGNLELQWDLYGKGGARTGIPDAVAAAGTHDLTVCVVGGSPLSTNEGDDRASLTLVGEQLELVQATHAAAVAAGNRFVLVLVAGKPIAEPWLKANVDAIIYSGFGGQSQGQATAEVIFGRVNPTGKLPITFPKSAAALPAFYSYHSGSRLGNWCDLGNPAEPLWAFGHGLSYTTFGYADLEVSPAAVGLTGTVRVAFTVRNTGTVAGGTVAQLYIKDDVSSITTPVLVLKGFRKLHLAAGAEERVTFELAVAEELWLVDHSYRKIVEPGEFTVHVGEASDDLRLLGNFTVHSV